MSCEACNQTQLEPLLDHFRSGCPSCSARAVAVVGDRAALLSDPLPADERRMLEIIFGDAWLQRLQDVRAWISAIRRKEAGNAASRA